jgi:hypothetical protein
MGRSNEHGQMCGAVGNPVGCLVSWGHTGDADLTGISGRSGRRYVQRTLVLQRRCQHRDHVGRRTTGNCGRGWGICRDLLRGYTRESVTENMFYQSAVGQGTSGITLAQARSGGPRGDRSVSPLRSGNRPLNGHAAHAVHRHRSATARRTIGLRRWPPPGAPAIVLQHKATHTSVHTSVQMSVWPQPAVSAGPAPAAGKVIGEITLGSAPRLPLERPTPRGRTLLALWSGSATVAREPASGLHAHPARHVLPNAYIPPVLPDAGASPIRRATMHLRQETTLPISR